MQSRVRMWRRSSVVESNLISERLFAQCLRSGGRTIDTRSALFLAWMVHISDFRYTAESYTVTGSYIGRELMGSNGTRLTLHPLPASSRRSPDRDRLSKPVPIIYSVDNWRVVNTERVNNAHSGQTVYPNARLSIDTKNFFLTVDPVGATADRTVVIDEEAVQACSEDEDVARLCDLQAPRGLLSSGEGRIFPLRERSVERARRWGVGLEIGRLGLRKTKVVVRSAREVVVKEDVMLRSRSYEPYGTSRFRQQTPCGINRGLVSV